ncbi:hypothetical protein Q9233_000762 [Columba guinea]|nr:hypothetical protein Q9233_000762 [Columba guinea]
MAPNVQRIPAAGIYGTSYVPFAAPAAATATIATLQKNAAAAAAYGGYAGYIPPAFPAATIQVPIHDIYQTVLYPAETQKALLHLLAVFAILQSPWLFPQGKSTQTKCAENTKSQEKCEGAERSTYVRLDENETTSKPVPFTGAQSDSVAAQSTQECRGRKDDELQHLINDHVTKDISKEENT